MYFNVLRAAARLRLAARPRAPRASGPDQHPGRHGEAEEAPVHLRRTPRCPVSTLRITCAHRHELQQHRERGAAGRQRPGRQALHVQMPGGDPDGEQRRHADERRIGARAPRPRGSCTAGDQEHHAEQRRCRCAGRCTADTARARGGTARRARRPEAPHRRRSRRDSGGAGARGAVPVRPKRWAACLRCRRAARARRHRARYGGCPCRAPCR